MSPTNDTTLYLDIFNSIDFEKIVDHPNILIAAHFWDKERYEAAKVCYKFMRAIDDFIDDYKTEHCSIAPHDRAVFEANVYKWINTIISVSPGDIDQQILSGTMAKFKIPTWPLEDFARSMIYDIHNDGFATVGDFLEYAGGASVAPASIFVHLCGLSKQNGDYVAPVFDIKPVALPCAIFSYLVHIIRDFVKDHTRNLNYFPDDLLAKYSLDRAKLLEMAKGADISPAFRNMAKELYLLADEYRIRTYDIIEKVKPLVEARSRLSLEIIFELYLMVFERIDIDNGNFSTKELNPSPDEIKQRVWNVIQAFEG